MGVTEVNYVNLNHDNLPDGAFTKSSPSNTPSTATLMGLAVSMMGTPVTPYPSQGVTLPNITLSSS
jgi:hypothetical protein